MVEVVIAVGFGVVIGLQVAVLALLQAVRRDLQRGLEVKTQFISSPWAPCDPGVSTSPKQDHPYSPPVGADPPTSTNTGPGLRSTSKVPHRP